jgi:hypothetical protein
MEAVLMKKFLAAALAVSAILVVAVPPASAHPTRAEVRRQAMSATIDLATAHFPEGFDPHVVRISKHHAGHWRKAVTVFAYRDAHDRTWSCPLVFKFDTNGMFFAHARACFKVQAAAASRLSKQEARSTAKRWARRQCNAMEHISTEPGTISMGCHWSGVVPPGCTRVIGDKSSAMGCAVEWLLTPVGVSNPSTGYSCHAVAQVLKTGGRARVDRFSSPYVCSWVSLKPRPSRADRSATYTPYTLPGGGS